MPILLVKIATSNVPDSPGRWRAGEIVVAVEDSHQFSPLEMPTAGSFYHVAVTDKTIEQVQAYLQEWRHEPTTTQISAQGNRRLIQVTSSLVSSTGKNSFTQAGVQALLDGINADYPTALAEYDSHTNTSFRFRVTAPLTGREELIKRINLAVSDMQYARRRWYITQSGLAAIASNGGTVSGTAAQVAGYLRDGLLD